MCLVVNWNAHTVHAQSRLLAPQRFKLKFLVQHFSQTLTTSLLPAFVGVAQPKYEAEHL